MKLIKHQFNGYAMKMDNDMMHIHLTHKETKDTFLVAWDRRKYPDIKERTYFNLLVVDKNEIVVIPSNKPGSKTLTPQESKEIPEAFENLKTYGV